uniref:Uncharacterized protein n=1 Tax=Grammatophora oceanica TaxID=210454 RepID=A0A7S1YMD3_9STRA|mmetsp:Transcript_9621/g.14126  ORF Transcript_9621/g.14126 Transcript_9621/m.14126 type:complete len:271 (+) Transcript_9621:94-906(+)|eukprot:CAMPEP_0194046746 /NCGR_PEP_ID=MMETSP0009_2-20130614/22280_1 /TAXON_ID=210454 /ORGANISM="Grammatophora oceanica, Strain CCMP 410" /LENGTH=270 /DNA_ID=CAMNT_0038692153 /DNA_START=94 /DNA_END=906 /DNA_ORIENTATION=+
MSEETPAEPPTEPPTEEMPLPEEQVEAPIPAISQSSTDDGVEVDPDEGIPDFIPKKEKPEPVLSFEAPEDDEPETPAAEPSLPEQDGIMYWGVTSELHMMCCEADQRPAVRSWDEVLEWVSANESTAKEQCLKREGELKLVPLAIVCQEAPLKVVETLAKLEPDALDVRDKYGDMPLHRCCLQNRNEWQFKACKLLLKHNSLKVCDGWGRTPLMCALESPRGPMKLPCYEILSVGGALEIPNRKGILPLKVAQTMDSSMASDICDLFECA